jgi:hypothetical protein
MSSLSSTGKVFENTKWPEVIFQKMGHTVYTYHLIIKNLRFHIIPFLTSPIFSQKGTGSRPNPH